MNYEELIGKKYNKLTVKKILYAKKNGCRLQCICDCGNEKEIIYSKLVKGDIKSCGCFRGNFKHNYSRTKLYKKWQSMKERCYDENNISYYRYGGRGIKVHDEWLESFVNFKDWAEKNGYVHGLSLERIDVHGNYEPSNCEWIKPIEQYKNKDWDNHIRKTGKEVLQIDLNSKKVIAIFPGIKVAERYIGVKGIDNVLRGKNKHAGGYYWRFADMTNEKVKRKKRKFNGQ